MNKEQLIESKVEESFEFFNENPTPTKVRDWLKSALSTAYDAGYEKGREENRKMLDLPADGIYQSKL